MYFWYFMKSWFAGVVGKAVCLARGHQIKVRRGRLVCIRCLRICVDTRHAGKCQGCGATVALSTGDLGRCVACGGVDSRAAVIRQFDVLSQERQSVPGWRLFECDDCNRAWKTATRDCLSLSKESCTCGLMVAPFYREQGRCLGTDESGNLVELDPQQQEIRPALTPK